MIRREVLSNGLDEAVRTGTLISRYARLTPDRVAVQSARRTLSFGALNARANKLARALRAAGLRPGDGVALICGNVPEFVEVFAAIFRAGFRWTPVNWHLTGREAAYIVADCEAKALIVHADHSALALQVDNPRLDLKLACGGSIAGFCDYEQALADQCPDDIEDPALGQTMLYTSGTTGQPKGVHRLRPLEIYPQFAGTHEDYGPETDVSLCVGPAYHGGPLGFDIVRPLLSGVPVVLMEEFDAEATLRAIERYRITHVHLVATMFTRLLRLPEAIRDRYDLSSLRVVFHGAAPTSVHIKRAMIDWWGEKFCEYYGATESAAAPQIRIDSKEWLRKPGSVGRLPGGAQLLVLDDSHQIVPIGKTGVVWFRDNAQFGFEYFKDPIKTASIFRDGYYTVGDMGFVDEDNYLFLTGRTSECIISGGVNIYPQEIDDVIALHPAVAATCAVGVPNEEWGEEVKAVVILRPDYSATPTLKDDLLTFARTRLASFKVPRSVEFVAELPFSAAGKILRAQVRRPYWEGTGRKI
jgi:long-chain acyl-CoA synthetase